MINGYDFDKTIYDGDSSVDFYKFCLKKNKKVLLMLPIQIYGLILYILGIIEKTKFKEYVFSFLKKIDDVDSYVKEFWKANDIKIKDWYLSQKEKTDIIISASPEFLLKPLERKYKFKVIASKVNKRLIENLSYSKPMQKGYYRKNLFLMYKDFNYVDDFVYYISPTIDSIILEFKKYGIKISFCYILSAISQVSALEKELDCMDTILALNFFDEFIVTNRFKINYDNKPIHRYALEFKGEYNLSKNLSISNKQPIFILVKEKKNDNESNKTGS